MKYEVGVMREGFVLNQPTDRVSLWFVLPREQQPREEKKSFVVIETSVSVPFSGQVSCDLYPFLFCFVWP